MTINTADITSGPYTGNGITDTFAYDFKIFDESELRVIETDTSDVQTVLVLNTDYTVTGVGSESGGNVVMTSPLTSSYTLYIRSDISSTQNTDFESQGGFFPDVHEDAIDKLTLLVQQLEDGESRTVKLSSDLDNDGVFEITDDAVSRSGKYLSFDSSGDVVLATGPQTVSVDLVFDTVAQMSVTSVDVGILVGTRGRVSVQDGGADSYYVVAGDSSNGYNKILLANGNTAVSQTVAPSLAQFGVPTDGVTDATASLQSMMTQGYNPEIKVGESCIITAPITFAVDMQQITVNGTLKTTTSMDALLIATDLNGVVTKGDGLIDGGGVAINGVHYIADTINPTGNTVLDVEVKNTILDAGLTKAGILFDNTGGKVGAFRHKMAYVRRARLNSVNTHGVLFAYCDGVELYGCKMDTVYNHGSEAVNCTGVRMHWNDVVSTELSALGVGDNTRDWDISHNTATDCGGDGTVRGADGIYTCETNSPLGKMSWNTVVRGTTNGINVSYGSPAAAPFDVVHDVEISHNDIELVSGAGKPTVNTGIGINIYSDPSAVGYNIQINHNRIVNTNKGISLNDVKMWQAFGNTVLTFQGTNAFAFEGIYVNQGQLHGLTIQGTTGDHGVQFKQASGAQKSERNSVSGVNTDVIAATKSVVWIESGNFYCIYDIDSTTAQHAVDCADATTVFQCGGITGNYVSTFTNSGNKQTWQA